MNICFRVTKAGNADESEKAFLKGATCLGLTGLKATGVLAGSALDTANTTPGGTEAGGLHRSLYEGRFG